jgi:hypothetical protein
LLQIKLPRGTQEKGENQNSPLADHVKLACHAANVSVLH